jgi:hypothetical protein
MTLRRGTWLLAATVAGSLCALLVLAPAASAATGGSQLVPLGFLGLPSLHSIIEAIAKGFFSALAGALVPGFLKHGSVALIQHLVALPDPASWGHVSELEGDMTYLGMSLMPVSLTVCTLRYWMMGLTGAAHPAAGIARCAWATFVLVIYRWLVEQVVAATNTLTHAILGFPVVANGLASIVTVLFGGALLIGAGGVFGAFLVIVGVAFAAGLFASKVALTDVLALAYCAGPLFIALWPIPELSHLMRLWSHALMAVVLVPLGWTLLFAVAGALTLDATSLSGGASGIGAHIEAAFAGLIAFVIAVKLPLMLLGELRNILGGASLKAGAGGGGGAQGQATMPGAQRMRAAHARLRNVGLEGIPSLGRSAERAAGALGAPAGGPLGAARRGLAGAARRTGMVPAAAGAGALGGMAAGAAARGATGKAAGRGGVRERLSRAGAILASAPRDARAAMAGGARRTAGRASARAAAAHAGSRGRTGASASNATGKTPARVATARKGQARQGGTAPVPARSRTAAGSPAPATPRAKPAPTSPTSAPAKGSGAAQSKTPGAHPGRKVTSSAGREAGPAPPARPASKPGQRQKPPNVTPPPPPRAGKPSQAPRRKRRPRGGGR